MKIQTTLLTSRIARRVVLLSFACALLPLLFLGLTSLQQVSGELEQSSLDRLDQEVRLSGIVVSQRLGRIEGRLRAIANLLNSRPSGRLSAKELETVVTETETTSSR